MSKNKMNSAYFSVVFFFIFVFISNTTVTAHAFFSPDLKSYSHSELTELLQSKRSASKKSIKFLLEHGFIKQDSSSASSYRIVQLKEWRFSEIRNPGSGIYFSGSGKVVLFNTWDTLSSWNLETGQFERATIVLKDDYAIYGNSNDGKVLVLGKLDKDDKLGCNLELAVYDGLSFEKQDYLDDSDELGIRKDNPRDMREAEYAASPDGRYFAMVTDSAELAVWDTSNGEMVFAKKDVLRPATKYTPYATFSPDGTLLYATHDYDKGSIFAIPDFREIVTFKPEKVVRPVISPNADSVLFKRKLFSIPDGKLLHKFSGKGQDVCFLPDGKVIYLENGDKRKFYKKISKAFELIDEATIATPGTAFHMWSKPAPSGDEIVNLNLAEGDGRVIVVSTEKVKLPDDKVIKLKKRVQKGIKLYRAGLKKEGIMMVRAVFKEEPVLFYQKNYWSRVVAGGMPLSLVSESLLEVKKHWSELSPKQRFGFYNVYDHYALWARQPLLALEGLKAQNLIASDEIIAGVAGWQFLPDVQKALALKLMGKDDEVNMFLLERVSADAKFSDAMLMQCATWRSVYNSFLKEKKKFAVILEVKESKIPDSTKDIKKQSYHSLDGRLLGGAPVVPSSVVKRPPSVDRQPDKVKPKSEKSSLILD